LVAWWIALCPQVIVPAVLLFGLGVLSLAFLSAHLWHFYAVYLFLGIVGSGTALVPYTKVISQWFDRQRGLALGMVAATFSASARSCPLGADAYRCSGLAPRL